MPAFICTACGMQYAPSEAPPPQCGICVEERQYVPVGGQGWTTLEKLADSRINAWRQYEPGLIGIGTQPHFAIGQRAILLRTQVQHARYANAAFRDGAGFVEHDRGNGAGFFQSLAVPDQNPASRRGTAPGCRSRRGP